MENSQTFSYSREVRPISVQSKMDNEVTAKGSLLLHQLDKVKLGLAGREQQSLYDEDIDIKEEEDSDYNDDLDESRRSFESDTDINKHYLKQEASSLSSHSNPNQSQTLSLYSGLDDIVGHSSLNFDKDIYYENSPEKGHNVNTLSDISSHLKGALSFGLPNKGTFSKARGSVNQNKLPMRPSLKSSASTGGILVYRPVSSKKTKKDLERIPRVRKDSDKFLKPEKMEKKKELDNIGHLSEELQIGYRILTELMADSLKTYNNIFMETIELDENINGDYLEVVKNPIWLPKIKEQLLNGKYKDITELISDIRLMLENTYRYFGTVNSYSRKALRMEFILEQKLNLLNRDLKAKCTLEVTHGVSPDVFKEINRVKGSRITVNGDNYFSYLLYNVRGCRPARDKELRVRRVEAMRKAKIDKEREMVEWEETLFDGPFGGPMRNMWEIPQISQFLFLSSRVLNISEISIYELERILMVPEVSMTLCMLMTSLVSSPQQRAKLAEKPFMPYNIWARKFAHKAFLWYKVYYRETNNPEKVYEQLGIEPTFWKVCGTRNPFDTHLFHELTLYQRIWLLKSLCDYIAHNHKSVQEAIAEQPEENQRESLLGCDRQGNEYIHFPQITGGLLRIYRRTKHKCNIDITPPEEELSTNVLFTKDQIKSFHKIMKKIKKNKQRDNDWEYAQSSQKKTLPKKKKKNGKAPFWTQQITPTSIEKRSRPERLRQTPKARYNEQNLLNPDYDFDSSFDEDFSQVRKKLKGSGATSQEKANTSELNGVDNEKELEEEDGLLRKDDAEEGNEVNTSQKEDEVEDGNDSKTIKEGTRGRKTRNPIACKTCGKRFSTKSAMYGHTAMHVRYKTKESNLIDQKDNFTEESNSSNLIPKEEIKIKTEKGRKSKLSIGVEHDSKSNVTTKEFFGKKEMKDEADDFDRDQKDNIKRVIKEELLDEIKGENYKKPQVATDILANEKEKNTLDPPDKISALTNENYTSNNNVCKQSFDSCNDKNTNDKLNVTDKNADESMNNLDCPSSPIQVTKSLSRKKEIDAVGKEYTKTINKVDHEDSSLPKVKEDLALSSSSAPNDDHLPPGNRSSTIPEDKALCCASDEANSQDNGQVNSSPVVNNKEKNLDCPVQMEEEEEVVTITRPDPNEFELVACSVLELRNLISKFGSLPQKLAKECVEKATEEESEKKEESEDEENEIQDTKESECNENEKITPEDMKRPKCEEKLHKSLCSLLMELAPFEAKMSSSFKQARRKLWLEYTDWKKRDANFVDPAEEAWLSDPEPDIIPSTTPTPKPSSSSSSSDEYLNDDGTRKRKLRKRRAKMNVPREPSPSEISPEQPSVESSDQEAVAVSSRGRVRKVKKIFNYDKMDFEKLAQQSKKEAMEEKERKKKKREEEMNEISLQQKDSSKPSPCQLPSLGIKRCILNRVKEVLGNDGNLRKTYGRENMNKFGTKSNSEPATANTPDGEKTPKLVVSAVNEEGKPVYVRVFGEQAMRLITLIEQSQNDIPKQIKLQRFTQSYSFSTDSPILTQNIPGYPDSDVYNPGCLTNASPSKPSSNLNSPELAPVSTSSFISSPLSSSTPKSIVRPLFTARQPNAVNVAYQGGVPSQVTQPIVTSSVHTASSCASLSSTTKLVTASPSVVPSVPPITSTAQLRVPVSSQQSIPSTGMSSIVIQTEKGQPLKVNFASDHIAQLVQKSGQRLMAIPNGKGGYALTLVAPADKIPSKPVTSTCTGIFGNTDTAPKIAYAQVGSSVIKSPVQIHLPTSALSTPKIGGETQQQIASSSSYSVSPQVVSVSQSPSIGRQVIIQSPVGRANSNIVQPQQQIVHIQPQNTQKVLQVVHSGGRQQLVQMIQAGQIIMSGNNIASMSTLQQPTNIVLQQQHKNASVIQQSPQVVLQQSMQEPTKIYQVASQDQYMQQPQQQVVIQAQQQQQQQQHIIVQQPVQQTQQAHIQMASHLSQPQNLTQISRYNPANVSSQVQQDSTAIAGLSQQQYFHSQTINQPRHVQQVCLTSEASQPQQVRIAQQIRLSQQVPQNNIQYSQLQHRQVAQNTELVNQTLEHQSQTQYVQIQHQVPAQTQTIHQVHNQPIQQQQVRVSQNQQIVQTSAQQSKEQVSVQSTQQPTRTLQQGRIVLIQTNEGQRVGLQLPDGRLSFLSAEQLQPLISNGTIKIAS